MDGTLVWVVGVGAVVLVLGIIGTFAERRGRGQGRAAYHERASTSLPEVVGDGSKPYTPEDHLRDAYYRAKIERKKAFRLAAFVVGVLVVAFLGSVEFRAFIAQFWQPMLFFGVGIAGMADAKRRVDEYNTWDMPYALSLVVGVSGIGWGIISLAWAW